MAIFDLDGTLTRRDTLLPYIARFLGEHPWRSWRLLLAAVALAGFACRLVGRDRAKELVIAACLGGASRDALTKCTNEFVEAVVSRGVHRAAANEVQARRQAGDQLIVLSASPDVYVRAIADRLGFDECICTELRWDREKLVGTFAGKNRRGSEKARIVAELKARGAAHVTVYANSSSDLEHLSLADRGVLVNGSSRARVAARRLGIECRRWT